VTNIIVVIWSINSKLGIAMNPPSGSFGKAEAALKRNPHISVLKRGTTRSVTYINV
jgi:hypothetical protein